MRAQEFFHNELPMADTYGVSKLNTVSGCEKAAEHCRKDAEKLSFYATAALVASVVAAAFTSFLIVVYNPASLAIGAISVTLLVAGLIARGLAGNINHLSLKIDLYSETLFDPIGRGIALTKKYWKPMFAGLVALEGISIISHVIRKQA